MRFVFIIVLFFSEGSRVRYRQIQWQKAAKLKSVMRGSPETLTDYWLSTDPNHFCADLNCNGIVNFVDYAIYTRDYL